MQKVILAAEYGYDSATAIVHRLIDAGFSVSASTEGKVWKIAAIRDAAPFQIDPALEKRANAELIAAGLIPA